MAYYDGRPGAPPRSGSTDNNTLSHRISNISDITDFETYHEDYPASPPLRARESLVSLQSTHDGARPSPAARSYSGSSGWSMPFSAYGSGGGYEPVPVTGGASASARTRNTYNGGPLRETPETIDEGRESIDLALLSSAAPMGASGPYSPIAGEEPDNAPVDWSSTLGPMSSNDPIIKSMQEQEAKGKLTGGLGAGFKAGAKIRESELLATGPPVARALSRSFSRRRPNLSRMATRKDLAQSEANKRGEVIEVIVEEPDANASEVDLSVMSGSTAGPDSSNVRSSTFPAKNRRTEIFYPQPNWKPFSMRWPYLLLLVVLSAGLGIGQEVLYQRSAKKPLVVFHAPGDIEPIVYFAFKFAPTIIAVTFGVLWQITDFEVKRLEAFYQLSKEGGASANRSINVDYITHFNFLRPIRAMYLQHYAVAVSSVASIFAVSLVPTLGAASIVLSPNRAARLKDPDGEKQILVHPVWSRLLTATFVIIAALGCVLFYQLHKRRSGLLADVKGIAGLAAMANVSHILMDFKDTDVATHDDIHHKLKSHRYVLRNSSLAPDDARSSLKQDEGENEGHHLSENPHPLMLRPIGAIIFILGIGAFMIFIPVFLFTPAGYVTDKAPWVVTALAVCIKLGWGSLDTDVRMMEPFYILWRRHAPPKTLTLDYTAMPFAWVAIKAFFNGHFLVFFVGFGTVMAEILTILVTSLATVEGKDFIEHLRPGHPKPDNETEKQINAGQETALSFWISLGMAVFILFYMTVMATVTFLRRRHPFLPRQPNTIASILAFIHQSKMLYDFVGTEKLNNSDMARTLDRLGKTYGLGWFEGRDGQSHCGVDQEELLASYKHGVDYSLSNKPWQETPLWL